MFKYIVKRFLHFIPLILGMTFVSFLIIKLAPGDFLTSLRMNPSISEETIKALEKSYGLNEPLIKQYFLWLWNALHFNLGYSFSYHRPVLSLIGERVGNTLSLTVTAFIVSWLVAVPLGIVAAYYRNRFVDRIITSFSLIGLSIPSFFLAFILMFLAAKTGWFPIGGVVSQNYESLSVLGKIVDRLKHMFIPLTAMVVGGISGLVRLIRGTVIEELEKEYVKLAVAKGLPVRVILFKHVLRNALNPFITLIGFDIAGLLSGAALIEIITAWPGMGRLMFDAVMAQDFFVVMGALYIGGIMLIIGNLMADILLALNDPRIREKEIEGRL
ncbi:ABC transporter permease [Desulfurobacterium atlanticum]|uniref:Peptide/nickel transport system permease protein n=1 Tax=Desulfurobacterium atlanticum TaxID=240169 RepID=A0A238XNB6_9BACT|nr:ABC transporter permease [Desulfurobacterium atlanticum]SNR59953.1 peptide/nickel transport system permease protein [Desulfurobacterium atlanticum]